MGWVPPPCGRCSSWGSWSLVPAKRVCVLVTWKLIRIYSVGITGWHTPTKMNMEPENTPLEEENHLPNSKPSLSGSKSSGGVLVPLIIQTHWVSIQAFDLQDFFWHRDQLGKAPVILNHEVLVSQLMTKFLISRHVIETILRELGSTTPPF